jgi:hypothetical protein
LRCHQVHEGSAGEWRVIAVDHGGEVTLAGADLHRGPAEQPRQVVERGGDREGERAHQPGFGGADGRQRGATGGQEGIAILGFGG